jgi:hypothetical protein
MADDIKTPEEINQATQALDKYIEKLKELNRVNTLSQNTNTENDLDLDQRIKYVQYLETERDLRQQIIKDRITEVELESQTVQNQDISSNFQTTRIEALQQEIELLNSISNIKEQNAQAAASNMGNAAVNPDNIGQGPSLPASFGTAIMKTLQKILGYVAAGGVGAATGGAAGLASAGVAPLADLADFAADKIVQTGAAALDFASTLDVSRRSMIPFIGSLQKTAESHQELALSSRDARISLEDLANLTIEASDGFSRFALETPEVISSLAVLEGQIKKLGGTGAASIIQSLIVEGDMDSIDDATERLKSLTKQMLDLGVTPKQFTQDFATLIPNLALFGSQAENVIARVSLAAAKSRVSVDTITGVAENFSTYSGAAQAIQGINSIFGEAIFTDPAELVSLFYEGGPEAIEAALRERLAGRLDTESGAGRAEIRALMGQLGMGSAQDTIRFFEDRDVGEQAIDAVDRQALDLDTSGLSGQFDELNKSATPLAETFKIFTQEVGLEAAKAAGTNLAEFSDNLEKISEFMLDQAILPRTREFSEESLKPFVDSIREMSSGLDAGILDPEDIKRQLSDLNLTKQAISDSAPIAAPAMTALAGEDPILGSENFGRVSDEVKRAMEEGRYIPGGEGGAGKVVYFSPEFDQRLEVPVGEISGKLDNFGASLPFIDTDLEDELQALDDAVRNREAESFQPGDTTGNPDLDRMLNQPVTLVFEEGSAREFKAFVRDEGARGAIDKIQKKFNPSKQTGPSPF